MCTWISFQFQLLAAYHDEQITHRRRWTLPASIDARIGSWARGEFLVDGCAGLWLTTSSKLHRQHLPSSDDSGSPSESHRAGNEVGQRRKCDASRDGDPEDHALVEPNSNNHQESRGACAEHHVAWNQETRVSRWNPRGSNHADAQTTILKFSSSVLIENYQKICEIKEIATSMIPKFSLFIASCLCLSFRHLAVDSSTEPELRRLLDSRCATSAAESSVRRISEELDDWESRDWLEFHLRSLVERGFDRGEEVPKIKN